MKQIGAIRTPGKKSDNIFSIDFNKSGPTLLPNGIQFGDQVFQPYLRLNSKDASTSGWQAQVGQDLTFEHGGGDEVSNFKTNQPSPWLDGTNGFSNWTDAPNQDVGWFRGTELMPNKPFYIEMIYYLPTDEEWANHPVSSHGRLFTTVSTPTTSQNGIYVGTQESVGGLAIYIVGDGKAFGGTGGGIQGSYNFLAFSWDPGTQSIVIEHNGTSAWNPSGSGVPTTMAHDFVPHLLGQPQGSGPLGDGDRAAHQGWRFGGMDHFAIYFDDNLWDGCTTPTEHKARVEAITRKRIRTVGGLGSIKTEDFYSQTRESAAMVEIYDESIDRPRYFQLPTKMPRIGKKKGVDGVVSTGYMYNGNPQYSRFSSVPANDTRSPYSSAPMTESWAEIDDPSYNHKIYSVTGQSGVASVYFDPNATVAANANMSWGFWLRPQVASGTLDIVSQQGSGFGLYKVDFANLSVGNWYYASTQSEMDTAQSTKISSGFKANSSGAYGMRLTSSSGTLAYDLGGAHGADSPDLTVPFPADDIATSTVLGESFQIKQSAFEEHPLTTIDCSFNLGDTTYGFGNAYLFQTIGFPSFLSPIYRHSGMNLSSYYSTGWNLGLSGDVSDGRWRDIQWFNSADAVALIQRTPTYAEAAATPTTYTNPFDQSMTNVRHVFENSTSAPLYVGYLRVRKGKKI